MKFKVEVGGYVSTYRRRTLTIHADTEEEAREKAINRFIDIQQQRPGDMCGGGIVNEITPIEKEVSPE